MSVIFSKNLPDWGADNIWAATGLLAEDRIFYSSLTVSVLIHLLLLASLFYAQIHVLPAPAKVTEVVYQAKAVKIAAPQKRAEKSKTIRSQKLSVPPKILKQKERLNRFGMEKAQKQPLKLSRHSKSANLLKHLGGKHSVSVPLLSSDKITNPKYLNYHELIRNKIKNRAYFFVDDPDFEAGEVYLTFVLQDNGQLKKVQILEDRTRANNFLRGIGLRSIKESAPFPDFPIDLKYPELSFNVVISFEVSE